MINLNFCDLNIILVKLPFLQPLLNDTGQLSYPYASKKRNYNQHKNIILKITHSTYGNQCRTLPNHIN